MKKFLILFFVFMLFMPMAFGWNIFKKNDIEKDITTVPLFNSELSDGNYVWAGTFQLLWNDLMDNVINGPVIFSNGQIKLAEELNKQYFDKSMLDDNSYYTAHGIMTKSLKKQIEFALKEKFNDKSDILDTLTWNNKDFLFYAILKKKFEFLHAYKQLPNQTFGKSDMKVKYFGFENNKPDELRDTIRVMFFNSPNDFAIKLSTKSADKIILYRTDKTASFEDLYNELLDKSRTYAGIKDFRNKDNLKVPYIEFDTKAVFKDLSGKRIKGTDFIIDLALQTIKFKLDNKGIELKSEAAMIMKNFMPIPSAEPPRNFYFDDKFVMFLIEKDKPYFALKIDDVASLK